MKPSSSSSFAESSDSITTPTGENPSSSVSSATATLGGGAPMAAGMHPACLKLACVGGRQRPDSVVTWFSDAPNSSHSGDFSAVVEDFRRTKCWRFFRLSDCSGKGSCRDSVPLHGGKMGRGAPPLIGVDVTHSPRGGSRRRWNLFLTAPTVAGIMLSSVFLPRMGFRWSNCQDSTSLHSGEKERHLFLVTRFVSPRLL